MYIKQSYIAHKFLFNKYFNKYVFLLHSNPKLLNLYKENFFL